MLPQVKHHLSNHFYFMLGTFFLSLSLSFPTRQQQPTPTLTINACSIQLTPAASSSLLQLPALSCSFQLSPAVSSTPAVSSSLLQLAASSSLLQLPALLQHPAHPNSFQRPPAHPLRHSTDVPLPIPAPADDLIQCLLTTSARFPNKRPLSSYHPPLANKDTVSIVYNGPSVFVILLCYCYLLAFVSPF
ncbi:unnamed protein product [Acanthosepion pharaonis]|uniref:Uncharacterized protein n=1 Tax=Acanthosepion pharaonis TaxID=158019 RepID=A0A812D2A7_ACAPH|nr:unnamed protein product [Sepia pharaonis]